jgi:type I restriction enzyme S subunit
MPEQLPTGWIKTTLGEIAQPSRTRVSPMDVPTARYVGLEHIESQSMRLIGNGFAREIRSSAMQFSEGDVLYGKMRPYLNKVWVAEFDGLCSAEFLVFRKHDGLNNQFLALCLNATDFVTFANGQVSGERPRVDFEKLSHFRILLPPFAEQERIVAKLCTAFSALQRAENAAMRALDRLRRLRDGVLSSAVTGDLTSDWRTAILENNKAPVETGGALLERLLAARLQHWEQVELMRLRTAGKGQTNTRWKSQYPAPIGAGADDLPELPQSWSWASVDQLAAHEERSIMDGPFGSNLKTSDYTDSGPRVVRLQNIGDGVFIDEKAHISQRHYQLLINHAVYAGDLVIRALGTPAPRACRIPNSLGQAIVKADCIRFKVASDFVSPDYILWALNSPPVRERTDKMIHGIGRPRLRLGEIKSIALPLPPLQEQSEIVREVEHRLSAANRLAETLKDQLIRSGATRQSLLREAFAGRLVNQNPNDDPASLLLEHIHGIREAEARKSKGGAMSTPKVKTKSVGPRNLLTVLEENGAPMTPEELFHVSGHSQESVDEFFAELRQLTTIPAKITEERKTGTITLLKAL